MNSAANKLSLSWKLFAVLIIGLAVYLLLGTLLWLALIAGLGFLVIGITATLIRRQPVCWQHVRENGVSAADKVARGCHWACVKGRQKAGWLWHQGGPAVRRGVQECWEAGRRRMQQLGGVAVETFSGAGLGALAGLAMMLGSVADTAIPLCAALGGVLGFFAGVFGSTPTFAPSRPPAPPTRAPIHPPAEAVGV